MTVQRGDIWLANLNPIRGSEQAGIRPVLVFQNDAINRFTTTVLAIPLTTNMRRAVLPSVYGLRQVKGAWRASLCCSAINYAYSIRPAYNASWAP